MIIQNLFKLKKGDQVKFNKKAYLWHQNHRKQKNSSLKPFPDWDLVKDFEFDVSEVKYNTRKNVFGNTYSISIYLEDDTICKGLSHIIHNTGTIWVLNEKWKVDNNPYIFFRRVR